MKQVAVEGGQRSEMECDFLPCEVEGRPKDTEEVQRPLSQAKARPQERRAVIRVESAETQDYI